jgi:hypothetical protein
MRTTRVGSEGAGTRPDPLLCIRVASPAPSECRELSVVDGELVSGGLFRPLPELSIMAVAARRQRSAWKGLRVHACQSRRRGERD